MSTAKLLLTFLTHTAKQKA